MQKTRPKSVALVDSDNWMGLYVDGELVYENHDIDADDLIDLLRLDIQVKQAHEEWLLERGRFPQRLKDVVEDGDNWSPDWEGEE